MAESEKLWGGRFTQKADETFAEFNRSLGFDRRLFAADIAASIAHANGLRSAGVLTNIEAASITDGLRRLRDSADEEMFTTSDAEDVHSFIEAELTKLIGDDGKKLHTGRSRNDQVATAFRLWLRDAIDEIDRVIALAQNALVNAAERHITAVLPGYTHLQRAQPVLWPHWCLAYFEMFERDTARLADARMRINIMPLGSGALAGTSFPIDRHSVAAELGFAEISRNSLDAVSDRDFAVEFTAACSLVMIHLSRLAEDLIIYCSTEFGFVELSEKVSTGSSLMPQKKNPDALELIRGKAGRVFGHNAALLATMKGLPLAYNKDMQEDKEAVFDTADTTTMSLKVAAIVLDELKLNEKNSLAAAQKGYLNATELADHLVRKGIPFRTAHETAGKIVLHGVSEGKELLDLSLDELRNFIPEIDESVYDALSLERTLATKDIVGGSSPDRVRKELQNARQRLSKKEENDERRTHREYSQ